MRRCTLYSNEKIAILTRRIGGGYQRANSGVRLPTAANPNWDLSIEYGEPK
jgi:hypothetical protein